MKQVKTTKQSEGMKWDMKRKQWIACTACALLLATALPMSAVAEDVIASATPQAGMTAQAQPLQARRGGRSDFRVPGKMGSPTQGNSLSSLTEAQKTAYQQALTAYQAAEDEALAQLVGGGILTQGEADEYTAQRASQQALHELDQSQWTQEQGQAFMNAMQKTGEERAAALAALVTGGQLTQAQTDALTAQSAQNWDNLWAKLANLTDDVTRDTLDALEHAQLTFEQTLTRAGIQGKGHGFMIHMGGMGNMGGIGRMGGMMGRMGGEDGMNDMGGRNSGNGMNGPNGEGAARHGQEQGAQGENPQTPSQPNTNRR